MMLMEADRNAVEAARAHYLNQSKLTTQECLNRIFSDEAELYRLMWGIN